MKLTDKVLAPVWVRLLLAVIALVAGVVALVIAVDVVRTVLS